MRPTLFGCQPGDCGAVVVAGLPFSCGNPAVAGCEDAPGVLRRLTMGFGLSRGFVYDNGTGDTRAISSTVSDLGDIPYRSAQGRADYLHGVARVSRALVAAGKRPLFLGGDHTVTLGVVRGLLQELRHLQILHLDAHTDFQQLRPLDEATHANFLAFVCELGVESVVQVGVRGFSRDPPSLPPQVRRAGVGELRELIDPDRPLYLTVDTDVFDPAIAPGVAFPVVLGMRWKDLVEVVRTLREARANLVGVDWVEYNPRQDSQNHRTAAGIIMCLFELCELLATSCSK